MRDEKDHLAEAREWARLANTVESFRDYYWFDHCDANGKVFEGVIYEHVDPLIEALVRECRALAGLKFSYTVGQMGVDDA